jgi:hypothetical protein
MDNVWIITLESLTKQIAQYIIPGNYLFKDERNSGTATEEQCFLYGPCRDAMSGTIWGN